MSQIFKYLSAIACCWGWAKHLHKRQQGDLNITNVINGCVFQEV